MVACPAGPLRAALPIMFAVWPGIFAFVPPCMLLALVPLCVVGLVLPLCTFEALVLP